MAKMDREKDLEILNENLKTLIKNQIILYCLIKEIKDEIQGEKGKN